MQLTPLCQMDLSYTDGFHLLRPYDGESGLGWGVGTGTATGERLHGAVQWSNHPTRRGDGAMLPSARGVITTDEGPEVIFDLSGRTVWVDSGGVSTGRQLLMALFEAEEEPYTWLNNTMCVVEGGIDPLTLVVHLEIHECRSDIS